MNSRIAAGIAAVSIALLGLTACAPAEPGSDAPPTSDGPAGAGASLATADSSLGTIVVDGDGMTVYQFDSDTQGGDASSCSGACASNWPAVPGGDAPELEGITGEVGTITGVDGEPQLTLDGWPLYYYAGDSQPGDVNGQGVNGTWWVLTPAGERVTDDSADGSGYSY
jgi:predicted lipoprotein with Yx(FWY)xxD motif